ncbi:MAG: hypothetical protein D6722_17665 [Bacteroidetes bacterium]|nr:MAG: hypothetical protein D6722_17665 [Bacteroidota bacterium]
MAASDPDTIPWRLIAANLLGSAGEAEQAELRHWRSAAPANETRYQQALRLWEQGGQLGPEFPFTSQVDWPAVAAQVGQVRRPWWTRPTLRVAAMVLLLLGLGALLWRSLRPEPLQWTEVHAQAEDLSLSLPDGSQVTLRQGASLRYPETFAGQVRHLQLSGEAWLEVVPDPERPLRVQGPDMAVTVLGTAFAFRDLPGDGRGQVDLVEGRVAVSAGDSLALSPGETARLAGDSLAKIPQNPHFLAWRQGELRFEDAPLDEVLPALSRYFERDFVLVGPAAPKARLVAPPSVSWTTSGYSEVAFCAEAGKALCLLRSMISTRRLWALLPGSIGCR